MVCFAMRTVLFFCCSIALASLEASAESPVDRLVERCRAAKAAFRPPSEADLQQAKTDLLAAVARLDAWLDAAGPIGDAWRAYLSWDLMQEQLGRPEGPDLKALDTVYGTYDGGYSSLQLACFADVRHALRRYLTTARLIGDPNLKSQYEGLLDALPDRLRAYDRNPTAEEALVIGEAVHWLQQAGQAPELVEALRDHFSQPNLSLEVSDDLLSAGLAITVDETEPIRDVILGTDIFGTGHTTGRVEIELVPAADHAEIHTVLRGTVASKTTGYKGPVRIYSDGLTQITSRKPLLIDAEHVWSRPAGTEAETRTTIAGIRSRFGGRCIERFAWRRACAQKSQADWIAARHAEQRVSRRVDKRAGDLVARANRVFRHKFRQPLGERKLLPDLLRFSTTESALRLTAAHRGPFGLAATSSAPDLDSQPDLAVRLHESMVNNFMAAALSGVIVEEEDLQARVTDLLGSLPEPLQPDEDAEPWGITFARRQPISVVFADGRLSLTIRGLRYTEGDNRYPGMNVTAAYQVRNTDRGPKAIRQGELEILPPGFDPSKGGRLSARQQVLRTLLEKRFGKIFTEELVPEELVLPGRWENAGKLALTRWEISNGWMILGWKRVPPAADQFAGHGSSRPVKP